ncbi:hypothetical protein DRO51_04400 [Candidatus Bathyarchaeota archaeon]|nr:MAG: hypothetical protein DRO51_04400 [Candidatus Bathyarchaeota archaeon]
MAVRIKLLVECEDRKLEIIALVNSGFETETPQLLLPMTAAGRLGLSPPLGGLEQTYDTAGGPTKVWVYPEKAKVKVLAGKTTSKEVKTDIVVSPIEDEALISDMLAGELELVGEDFGKGLWRLSKEKELHQTEKPQLWK